MTGCYCQLRQFVVQTHAYTVSPLLLASIPFDLAPKALGFEGVVQAILAVAAVAAAHDTVEIAVCDNNGRRKWYFKL